MTVLDLLKIDVVTKPKTSAPTPAPTQMKPTHLPTKAPTRSPVDTPTTPHPTSQPTRPEGPWGLYNGSLSVFGETVNGAITVDDKTGRMLDLHIAVGSSKIECPGEAFTMATD